MWKLQQDFPFTLRFDQIRQVRGALNNGADTRQHQITAKDLRQNHKYLEKINIAIWLYQGKQFSIYFLTDQLLKFVFPSKGQITFEDFIFFRHVCQRQ